VPPIAAFVAAGFEHSVANMYFFPVALFHGGWDTHSSQTPSHVTWSHFLLDNLIPVTVGNIIGGAVLVGLVYWFVYLHVQRK
jgi:formate/nitrite transporter FocA (FNT family)